MSIKFFEGWETVGTELGLASQGTTRPRMELRWDETASGGLPASDSFFLIDDEFAEGYAVCMTTNNFGSGNYFGYNLDVADMQGPGASFSEWIVGFRLHVPITARTDNFFLLKGRFGGGIGDGTGSGTDVIGFDFVDSTDIRINRANPSAFTIDTAVAALTPGAWHYVEIRVKIAESGDGGRVELWVDDVLVSDTIADTNNALTTGVDKIQFHTGNGTTTTDDFVGFDDLYIIWAGASPHTSRLGPTRVRTLPPISNVVGEWGGYTELTLATTLNGAAETQIDVGSGNIPSGQEGSGNIKVTLDTGQVRTVAYTSHDSDRYFAIASSDWTGVNDATVGNDVLLPTNRNWDMVDENGADATNYVETDQQGKRDRYNITDLTESGSIWCLKIEAEAINITGGEPSLTIELKSGATTSSTEVIVDDLVNYAVFQVLHEQDPNTSADWLNTDVDAILAGFLFDNKVS